MKKSTSLFILFSLVFTTISLALPNRPVKEKTESISAAEYRKVQKKQAKRQKRAAKINKKFQKLEKKLAKRGIYRTEAASSVWEDETFKLGALVALGGLLLTILGVLPILGGIFALIGGLMMLVGVVLMIWVLIESY